MNTIFIAENGQLAPAESPSQRKETIWKSQEHFLLIRQDKQTDTDLFTPGTSPG